MSPLAQDLFADVENTLLENHTPDLGWTGWRQPGAGAAVKIQSNEARQTTNPFGGRRHTAADPGLQQNFIRVRADVRVASNTNLNGVGLYARGNGGLVNASIDPLNCIEAIQASLHIQIDLTVDLFIRRYRGCDDTSDDLQIVPEVLTGAELVAGRHLVLEIVDGDQLTVRIQPTGGGVDEQTFGPLTIPAPTYNDASHQHAGMVYERQAIWDNFTAEQINQPPSAPGAITSPTTGQQVVQHTVQTVAWGAATDPESDPLQYEGDVHDGVSWSPLFALQPGLTFDWDVGGLAVGDNYKIRVRAHDGVDYGPYAESGLFSVVRKWAQDPVRVPSTWVQD